MDSFLKMQKLALAVLISALSLSLPVLAADGAAAQPAGQAKSLFR